MSRRFDAEEVVRRTTTSGDQAKDDDGNLIQDETRPFDSLEVAHILPHALTKVDTGFGLVSLLIAHVGRRIMRADVWLASFKKSSA